MRIFVVTLIFCGFMAVDSFGYDGFLSYQAGFSSIDNTTRIWGADQSDKKIEGTASKLEGRFAFYDGLFGDYKFMFYSANSLMPTEEEDNGSDLISYNIAVGSGGDYDWMPSISISKYSMTSEHEVNGSGIQTFDIDGNLIAVGDDYVLENQINKFTLFYGSDARNANFSKRNNNDFIGHIGVSYYSVDLIGAVESGSSYSTAYLPTRVDIESENFKALGLEFSLAYATKPINKWVSWRLGCSGELAAVDVLIMKVGYFGSLIFGNEGGNLKGIATLQGNLLSHFEASGEWDDDIQSPEGSGAGYDLLVGVAYTF